MSYFRHEIRAKFYQLLGKTLTGCVVNKDADEITFTTTSGEVFRQAHDQSCCENVFIEDISGDLSDLLGSPILEAEEVTSSDGKPNDPEWKADEYEDSYTWTFYKLGTIKGHVNIRWYGSSNGYYSEDVEMYRIAP